MLLMFGWPKKHSRKFSKYSQIFISGIVNSICNKKKEHNRNGFATDSYIDLEN